MERSQLTSVSAFFPSTRSVTVIPDSQQTPDVQSRDDSTKDKRNHSKNFESSPVN